MEVTDINIAARAANAGTSRALLFQSPKCLFCLVVRATGELKKKLSRWGTIRAYLVLSHVNLDPLKPSFTKSDNMHKDTWGYYWEKCRCVQPGQGLC